MTVHEAIRVRRSVRAYSPRPIPEDVMQRLRQALHFAPSACNNQPWRFILVTEPELKRQLGRAAREQTWIADAPLIVVACGFARLAYPRMGGKYNSLDIDLAIALDHLMLAATAEGLGTCWIGAFSEEQVKALLGVPADVRVLAMTPLGYPASEGLIRPIDPTQRKPERDVFCSEHYTP